ncbi:MAG: signal peptidase II [Actinoallomurus sp.]
MNPDQEAAARPRRIGVLVAVAAAALALDAISKVIVVALLQDHAPIKVIGGLLTLRVLRNSGAAFNIGNGMTYVFTVIATAVVVAILRYARRLRSLPWAVTLGLLLGGALGNLADRMLRSPGPLRGHVVDWIELPHWPVFNLADSAIVCGGALAVVLASRGLQVDGTVYRDGEPASGEVPATSAVPGSGEAPAGVVPGEGEAPAKSTAPAKDEAPAKDDDPSSRESAAPGGAVGPAANGGTSEGDGPAGDATSVRDAKH